ncbi:C-C motif chemokine 25 isoform X1 [Saccopteryx leptura]|uniref:C-C motif chemokine 25 isoform X1 n=2 Tax=Saccopteryx leptura TaxID=249018 RepID=UPI00339C935D
MEEPSTLSSACCVPIPICLADTITTLRGSEAPTCTMNLWLLACLVTCFVDIWAPAIQAQGVFEDCCLAYHPHVSLNVLRHARRYVHQDVSGSCNLHAVIFYFPRKQKRVCGKPQAKWVQKGITLLKSQQKHPEGPQGSHSWGKKLSSGPSRLRISLSTFRDHTRNNKRNISLQTTANPGL